MKRLNAILFSLLVPSMVGCVGSAQVQSDQLPVKKVVVYRNGVAYFERGGKVDSEEVHFKLRQENVGDFLATLAVLEKGGHSVKAASFPVKMDEPEAPSVDPELQLALDSWEGKKKDPRELRKVTLELDGEKHELKVGYLAETPLWRPSYRLVVGMDGEAVLQAWGIVQNQSGEDWNDVEIALVAGAPIAFQSNLGEPVVPSRPWVTDRGEVIHSVPEGSTTLHEASEEEARPALSPESVKSMEMERFAERDQAPSAPVPGRSKALKKKGRAALSSMSGGRGGGDAAQYDMALDGAPADDSRLAKVELQTGATRYAVPHRVTIPDQSATMVLLVSKKVAGEAVYLYSPDGGVPASYSHPFRVARFKNQSGGLLERGPIAVFEKGAFLGQGVVETLPNDAQATVPFALMRSLSIAKEVSYDQRGARLYSVAHGNLTIERDQATITTYRVQNGEAEKARILVRHQKSHGAKLWDPPKGTEELSGKNAALIPVDVSGHAKSKLLVEERRPIRRQVDWMSQEARNAVRDFIKSGGATESQVRQLESILKHAAQLSTITDDERRLTREQRELERSTSETRKSLKAIKDNAQAAQLRKELTDRLAKGTRRLDGITKDLVELGLRRTEQEVRLKEARQGLVIAAPDRR